MNQEYQERYRLNCEEKEMRERLDHKEKIKWLDQEERI